MTWLIFALLAPAGWAVGNLIDEHLVRHDVRNPLALVITTGLFSGFSCALIVITGHFAWIGMPLVLFAIASGIFGLLTYLPYFYALKYASPAAVLLMWNLGPVIVVVLAWLFLHERLLSQQYGAIALLVVSACLASYKPGHHKMVSRAVPFVVLASVFIAIALVLEKALYMRVSFAAGFGWISLTVFVMSLLFLISSKKSRNALRHAASSSVVKMIVLNEALDVGATAATSFAVSRASVSLVEGVGGLQPLFVMVFGWLWAFMKHRRSLIRLKSAQCARLLVAVALAMIGFVLL